MSNTKKRLKQGYIRRKIYGRGNAMSRRQPVKLERETVSMSSSLGPRSLGSRSFKPRSLGSRSLRPVIRSLPVIAIRTTSLPQPRVLRSSLKKHDNASKKNRISYSRTSDDDRISKAWKNRCYPYKDVIFSGKGAPYKEYLQNVKNRGRLGCDMSMFPKYRDGRYCCEAIPSSNQEQLDYINSLLQAFITNVSDSVFNKNEHALVYLLYFRHKLVTHDNRLVDNLKIPEAYETIGDWIKATRERVSREIDETRYIPKIRDDPVHNLQRTQLAYNVERNKPFYLEGRETRARIRKELRDAAATDIARSIIDMAAEASELDYKKAKDL